MVIESGFPVIYDNKGEGKGNCSTRERLSFDILAKGRGLLRAWARIQGNTVIDHSVRLEDADNPIIAAMKVD